MRQGADVAPGKKSEKGSTVHETILHKFSVPSPLIKSCCLPDSTLVTMWEIRRKGEKESSSTTRDEN